MSVIGVVAVHDASLSFEVGAESVGEVGAAVLAFGAEVSAAVFADERDQVRWGHRGSRRARGH
jgi:hypothetical protein